MTTGTIYLNFDGQTEEAFHFYKSVLGGEFTYLSHFGDMPAQIQEGPLPDEFKTRIMHVALVVNPAFSLFGSDTMPGFGPALSSGNNFSISLDTASKEEADRLFYELSDGGTVMMPMQNTFWDAYFGQLRDRFGIHWMINWEIPK